MKLTWQHVAVVALLLGAIVAMAKLGQDTAALFTLGAALLGGLGLVAGRQEALREQGNAIREQGNGNTTELLRLVREMAVRLAEAQPPLRVTADVGEPIQDAETPPTGP